MHFLGASAHESVPPACYPPATRPFPLRVAEFPDAPEFGIPLSRAQALIRGRGAFVYQVAQAMALGGEIVLRQMSSPYMTETHIYVGLSRAKGLELLRAAP